jgi:hypothetical protein
MRRAHELGCGSCERAEGSEASAFAPHHVRKPNQRNWLKKAERKGPQGVTVLGRVCNAE